MAEAVAKTGAYDIFNQFPSVVPDAAGAGVILPLDEYAAKGQPDFSGMESPLRAQQFYHGQLYFLLLSGDQLMLVLRKDLLELPGAREEWQTRYGREPGVLTRWRSGSNWPSSSTPRRARCVGAKRLITICMAPWGIAA